MSCMGIVLINATAVLMLGQKELLGLCLWQLNTLKLVPFKIMKILSR